MRLVVSLVILLFGAVVVLVIFGLMVLEMSGKVKHLKEDAPWLITFLLKRESQVGLLLVCALLLTGNGYEVLTKEIPEVPAPPIVKIAAPLAPQLQILEQTRIVTRALPAPEIETQITHWENFIPTDPRYGSGLRMTIATNEKKGPIQLLIVCSGEIEQFPKFAKSSKGITFVFESQETLKSHADVFNVKWKTPEWTPDDPLVFEFLSRTQIHPKWVIPISYNPNQ